MENDKVVALNFKFFGFINRVLIFAKSKREQTPCTI